MVPAPKALREAAAAFYEPAISEANLKLFGGSAEDYEYEVELLPGIEAIFNAFTDLRTQWRIGPMGGVTGLIYSSIPVVLMAHGIPNDAQAMRDILAMELSAMAMINKKPEDQPDASQV